MSRHRGMFMYAVCDGIADDSHNCPAFVVPAPHGDPAGPGHVFAGYLDLTNAGRAAGWLMDDDGRTLCPKHRPALTPRPSSVADVDALAIVAGDAA